MLPSIGIFLHGEPVWPTVQWVNDCEHALQELLPDLLAVPHGLEHVLSTLQDVEISLVDDTTIARVHAEFLNDPEVTDVITFPYGEIIVSYDTAVRYAVQHGIPKAEELLRYMIHGLTHLHGYLDATAEQRDALFAVQEQLISHCRCTPLSVQYIGPPENDHQTVPHCARWRSK